MLLAHLDEVCFATDLYPNGIGRLGRLGHINADLYRQKAGQFYLQFLFVTGSNLAARLVMCLNEDEYERGRHPLLVPRVDWR